MPADTIPLVQEDGEPFERVVISAERPPGPLTVCPVDVARALAVAGLAANADFHPCSMETVTACIVVLLHARRMALRAHEIPVLIEPGPVQHIVVLDFLVGI